METVYGRKSPEEYAVLGYYDDFDPSTGNITKIQVRLSPLGTEYYVPLNKDDLLGRLAPGTIIRNDNVDRRTHSRFTSVFPTRISRARATEFFGENEARTLADFEDNEEQIMLRSAMLAAKEAEEQGKTRKQQIKIANDTIKGFLTEANKRYEEEPEELANKRREMYEKIKMATLLNDEARELSLPHAEYLANKATMEAIEAENRLKREKRLYNRSFREYTEHDKILEAIEKAKAEAAEAAEALKKAEDDLLTSRKSHKRKSPSLIPAKTIRNNAEKLFEDATKRVEEEIQREKEVNDTYKTMFKRYMDLYSEVRSKIRKAEKANERAIRLRSPEEIVKSDKIETLANMAAAEAVEAEETFNKSMLEMQKTRAKLIAIDKIKKSGFLETLGVIPEETSVLPSEETSVLPSEEMMGIPQVGITSNRQIYFPGYYDSSGNYEVMRMEYERNPNGDVTEYEIRVSPSGVITRVPVNIEFKRRRVIRPLQRSTMRSLMTYQAKRYKPTQESRKFATSAFKIMGGRGKVAAPSMIMGSQPIGGGRKSPSSPRVSASGGGRGFMEIMRQEEENKTMLNEMQKEREMLKGAYENMLKDFLEYKGVRPSTIESARNLDDLAILARSTVFRDLNLKTDETSGRMTLIERDIAEIYDNEFRKTGDLYAAENAAQVRKNAYEYAAGNNIINRNLKGKVPAIGTPSRLIIDKYVFEGEDAAENLRQSLVRENILTSSGTVTTKFNKQDEAGKEKLLKNVLKRTAVRDGNLSTIKEDTEGFQTVVPRSQSRRSASPPRIAAGGGGGGGSNTGKPATGKPATGKPATGKPATGKPATGKPATGKPATGKPATGSKRK
jgi:hypothetical protein